MVRAARCLITMTYDSRAVVVVDWACWLLSSSYPSSDGLASRTTHAGTCVHAPVAREARMAPHEVQ